jgi:hypothetical protein
VKHVRPQAPQFMVLVFVLTHAPPQAVRPLAQLVVQVPFEQT